MFFGAGLGAVTLAQAIGVAGFLLLVWLPRNVSEWEIRFSAPRIAYAATLFVVAILVGYGRVESSPFLYFRF